MLRTLSLIAALSALAAPAAASEIRISTAGKDVATLRAEIKTAAQRVCRRDNPGRLSLFAQASCVEAAVASAMTQMTAPAAAMAFATPLSVTRISSEK